MAMNRIQFQPGLSLAGFLQQYGTEAALIRAGRNGLSVRAATAGAMVIARIGMAEL